jgi:hypothetical protein
MEIILKATIAITCMVGLVSLHTFAQKLPNKQEGSMRSPDKVKIDGKVSEWTLKAFNKSTDIFYSIANDNDNLYLVVKADDPGIIRKILSSGITFSVNASGKRSDTATSSITYPVFNYKTKPYINFKDKPTGTGIDSFVLANNKRFSLNSKFIRTAGFKRVDTLISVYNSDGIRVASTFDDKMSYSAEMAVSLSHIRQALNTEGKLFYRLTLNAIKLDDMPGVTITRDAGGTVTGVTVIKRDALPNSAGMNADTDFSGEYILAK